MDMTQRDAHRVSADASKAGAKVIGGQLSVRDGNFMINQTNLTELLENLEGQNVFLVVGTVQVEAAEKETRTCLTCGREYIGQECPRCARVRARLRG